MRWGIFLTLLLGAACTSDPSGTDAGADAAGADRAAPADAADGGPGRDADRADAILDADPADAPGRDADPADALPTDADPADAPGRDADPADALPTDADPTDAGPVGPDECLGQAFPLIDGARWLWAMTATTGAVTATATEVLLLSDRAHSSARASYLAFKPGGQLSTYGYGIECRPDGLLVVPEAFTFELPPAGPVHVELTSATGLTLPKTVTPGQSWQATYGLNAMGFQTSLTIRYQAGALETVVVPRGTYSAHPISATFTLVVPAGPQPLTLNQAATLWLAPGHGVVKLGPDTLTRTFGQTQTTTSDSKLIEEVLP